MVQPATLCNVRPGTNYSDYGHATFSDGTSVRLRDIAITEAFPEDGSKTWCLNNRRSVRVRQGMLLTDFLAVLTYLEGA